MRDYDVFMCYRGEKAALFAGRIYADMIELRNDGVKIFYAPETLAKGERIEDICKEVAANVRLMMLFITSDFFDKVESKNDVVGMEIQCALDNPQCRFLPILMDGFNFADVDLEKIYGEESSHRISSVNAIRYYDVYTFESGQLFGPICAGLAINLEELHKKQWKSDSGERTHIKENEKEGFFSDKNVSEKNRLNQQQNLLLDYDMPIYEKLLAGKSGLNVLDLGSGNGSTVIKRLGNRPEVSKIIGIEFEELNVENANKKYGNDNIRFYQADIEAPDFGVRLTEIMEENNIDNFDFINILALLAHLKNPSKLFKVLKVFCPKGASVFIRNMDDGFNVAYPDREGNFAQALSLMPLCPSCGYRFSGRQVFSLLKERGYESIVLESTGISTVGMDKAQRETFYDVIFGFIENGLNKEVVKNPKSEEFKQYKAWFDDKKESLEHIFLMDEFFFFLGFVIYTATLPASE